MVRGRAKGHEHSSLKTEGGELVANALLSLWRCIPEGLSKLLECCSLIITHACEVLVDGLGFTYFDLCTAEVYLGSPVQRCRSE